MYNEYIRSILPIPIIDIKVAKNNNYRYKVVAYSSVADESQNTIKDRVRKCKRMKSIEGWYFDDDTNYKYAVIEFNKGTGNP